MKALVGIIAAAALVVGPPAIATAVAAEPTRVLLVGDSVTHGRQGDHTWRYFASRGLGPRVDFVGNRVGTLAPDAAEFNWDGTYADPSFDTDHAARWGMSMYEMMNNPSNLAPSIGDLVTAHDPDVVVESLGINDLKWRYGDDRLHEAVDNVKQFVAEARAAKPDVHVVLGTLPQTWIAERVGTYNNQLAVLAAELSTSESRVVVSPLAGWSEADTYDGLHPVTSGQRSYAESMVKALSPLIVQPALEPEPEPTLEPAPTAAAVPSPSAATIPSPDPVTVPSAPLALAAPAAPRRVRAIRKGSRVAVSWRAVQGAKQYVVRCGDGARVTSTTRTAVRSSGTRCKVRALGGGGRSPWVVVRVGERRRLGEAPSAG